MKSLFPFRLFGSAPEDIEASPMVPIDSAAQPSPASPSVSSYESSIHPDAADLVAFSAVDDESGSYPVTIFKTVGWISAGLGAIALGLVVGREIRIRYKFNRRTPYDFYAHAGDERDLEFGVGI